MKDMVKKLVRDESGQGMVEYALIIALISIAALTVLTPLGTSIREKFQEVLTSLNQS